MKKKLFLLLISVVVSTKIKAQGPPIISDKPIMLGSKRVILKSLTEYRKTANGTFLKVPFMANYLPTPNLLLAAHIPYVNINFNTLNDNFSGFGNIEFLLKYQFFRKDTTGKTFRIVAKTLQILPSNKNYIIDGILTKTYQSYFGIVSGYESIKYGVVGELGLNTSRSNSLKEFRQKLGFGLPLFKPKYPVKQLNLYFEYQSNWFYNLKNYQLLYAQGIQLAIKRLTLEISYQFPVYQNKYQNFNNSVFFGTRYIF